MHIGMISMGFLVGFLVGLTGVGGAAVLTPVLLLIGVQPVTAVGTDLIYNAITKGFGAVQHWRQKHVDLDLVKTLAIGSVPGAVVAVLMLHFMGGSAEQQNHILKPALGAVLMMVAVVTIIRTVFDKQFKLNRLQLKPDHEKRGLGIIVGAVLGFMVGLTSVGAGTLFTMALIFLYNLTPARMIGTDIAHAFILVTVAGVLHAGFGNVNYGMVVNLLTGSIPGVLLGSYLTTKVMAKPLRIIMATLVFASGLSLI